MTAVQTILSQIESTKAAIAENNEIISTNEREWQTRSAEGAMDEAIAAEEAIIDAKRSIARLHLRLQALEAQSTDERKAQLAEQTQHLKDAAIALGQQFETELGTVVSIVSRCTDATWNLSLLAQKVSAARRAADKAGVVFDQPFKPQARLQQMLRDANRNAGNCENLTMTDFVSPVGK